MKARGPWKTTHGPKGTDGPVKEPRGWGTTFNPQYIVFYTTCLSEDIKSQLLHQHSSTLDDVTRQYETKLAVAKSEMEKHVEASQRKEEDFNRKVGLGDR